MNAIRAVVLLVAAVFPVGACRDRPAPPGPATPAAATGEELYSTFCSSCHGDDGRGDGIAAPFCRVSPASLTRAEFKVRSTPAGALPCDADLAAVIRRGAGGDGAMPPFSFLAGGDVERLVARVKALSPRWQREQAPPRRGAGAASRATRAGVNACTTHRDVPRATDHRGRATVHARRTCAMRAASPRSRPTSRARGYSKEAATTSAWCAPCWLASTARPCRAMQVNRTSSAKCGIWPPTSGPCSARYPSRQPPRSTRPRWAGIGPCRFPRRVAHCRPRRVPPVTRRSSLTGRVRVMQSPWGPACGRR